MAFDTKDKVALITGGASGIGLSCAKELLRNDLRGVTLADIDAENGKKAVEEITSEFGDGKVIFVHTDVVNKKSFEDAFKKTIQRFKNVDILINNAGILDDVAWEKSIAVNVTGSVNGLVLGIENYIPKHRSGPEGVIVNMSSMSAFVPFVPFPVYTATKCASLGMVRAYGSEEHYKRTKVKVLAICPSFTDTPMTNSLDKTLNPASRVMFEKLLETVPMQKPEAVAAALVKAVKEAKSGTAWVVKLGSEPYEYTATPRNNPATKF